MSQIHLRVRRAAFRGKDQPSAIGGKAVPGIHQRRIGPHAACFSPLRRHDVELAVRTHQQTVARLHVDDPTAIGRNLGEGIAHSVPGCAGHRLRRPAFAPVEGNAVEVVLNPGFVRIVGEGSQLDAFRIRRSRFGPGKHEILAVRAPDGVGLHVARVIGPRQRLQLARGPAVPGQNATRRIKHLQEAVVLEIGDVVIALEVLLEQRFLRIGSGRGRRPACLGAIDHRHHVLPAR